MAIIIKYVALDRYTKSQIAPFSRSDGDARTPCGERVPVVGSRNTRGEAHGIHRTAGLSRVLIHGRYTHARTRPGAEGRSRVQRTWRCTPCPCGLCGSTVGSSALLVICVFFEQTGAKSPLPHFSTGVQNYVKCREFQHRNVQMIPLHPVNRTQRAGTQSRYF